MAWEEDQDTLKNMVYNHFIDLFHETERKREQLVVWNSCPITLEMHNAEPRGRVTLEEVKKAIFDMGPPPQSAWRGRVSTILGLNYYIATAIRSSHMGDACGYS